MKPIAELAGTLALPVKPVAPVFVLCLKRMHQTVVLAEMHVPLAKPVALDHVLQLALYLYKRMKPIAGHAELFVALAKNVALVFVKPY